MSPETKAQRRAVESTKEAVEAAGRAPEDPGLRDRFSLLPRAPIRIICCPLDKRINHGNILRLAECFRLEEVCFAPVGSDREKDYSGGFAAVTWQPHRWVDTAQAVREAKDAGFRAYGLVLCEGALPLRAVKWRHPAALVLGRELEGLDKEVEELCDELVAVPLYGMVQSLNVAVSAAIVAENCFTAFLRATPGFEPARVLSRGIAGTP
ncbi:MAG: hypothetical protein IH851_03120 [Armatimonadetes bacterium]|nr:hypothetical protein [Armatimonadota bacterium]